MYRKEKYGSCDGFLWVHLSGSWECIGVEFRDKPARAIVAKLAGFLTIFAGALGTVGSLIDDLVSKKPSDLAGMSIEDVLKADKNNYAIPHSDIIKVEINKKGFITKPSIWISTATKKHIFLILNEEMFDRCVNLVHTTLSGKL